MKKLLSILGSTGSIGLTTLNIIDKKKNYFKPFIFSANKNYKSICKQIIKYRPKYFVINDYKVFKKVKNRFKNIKNIKILNDFNLIKLNKKTDVTITAIPGIEGLKPTILAIKFSKKILIANKESIICGWDLIKKNIKKYKTKVIPIDSEHFSIFKLLQKVNQKDIKKIYITASGGPFLNFKLNNLKGIKPNQAIKHPKWKMGKKISIDSATLMNKVLEVIEAQKIFNISKNKIGVLIHPESLIHAFIEFKNGLTYFIYHETSMTIPIANAIFDSNVEIKKYLKIDQFNFEKNIKNMTFRNVDSKLFPSIKLIKEINKFPSTSIIVNAANEILVDQFLRKNIEFLSILRTIKTILNDRNYKKYAIRKPQNINQITEIDHWARKLTLKKLKI
jgi:1-deoxy-D-xylulose-5-phosphate reductoisomerase